MPWLLVFLYLELFTLSFAYSNFESHQIPLILPNTTVADMAQQECDGFRTVAYFVNWAIYARNHNPQDLPADKLTHILYSFANVKADTGEVFLTDSWSDAEKHYPTDSWNDVGTNVYGCLKQLNLLKRKNRNLKVLLSIGGWTYSSNFAAPASTAQGRAQFAKTAVQLVKDYGFDGLDIDWEYPQDEQQARDYVSLLHACRRELDAYQRSLPPSHQRHRPPHFLLTIAAPAGPQNYEKLHLKEMSECLDFINLMAYDYAGSWDQNAGHQANFFPDERDPKTTPFSTARALKDYVRKGVPPNKIVLGMPLYGRSFLATDGPGTPYSGTGDGSWERGVWDFKALPRPGAREQHASHLGVSWCYDPSSREMVTYDTRECAEQKTQLIKDWDLGGAMWWESSAFKAGHESLIGTVHAGLERCGRIEWRENEIHYPESKFENLKTGFEGEC